MPQFVYVLAAKIRMAGPLPYVGLDPGPGTAAGRTQWQGGRGPKYARATPGRWSMPRNHRTRKGAMRREFVLKNDKTFRAQLKGRLRRLAHLRARARQPCAAKETCNWATVSYSRAGFVGAGNDFEQIATGGCQSYLLGLRPGAFRHPDRPRISIRSTVIWAWRQGRSAHPLCGWTLTPMPITSRRPRNWARHWRGRWSPATLPAPYADFAAGRRRDPAGGAACGSRPCTHQAIPATPPVILAEDRIFTGDTLLIGGTGRTDLPHRRSRSIV